MQYAAEMGSVATIHAYIHTMFHIKILSDNQKSRGMGFADTQTAR
jgi:hypothetical protein